MDIRTWFVAPGARRGTAGRAACIALGAPSRPPLPQAPPAPPTHVRDLVLPDRGRPGSAAEPAEAADDGDFSRSLDLTSRPPIDGFTAIGPTPPTTGARALPLKDRQHLEGGSRAPVREGGTGGTAVRAAEVWRWREPGPRCATGPASTRRVVARRRDPQRRRVVAVAQLSRNGQVVSELWRSDDGGRTYVVVERPEAELDQPVALPVAVVRAVARRWSSVTAVADRWCGLERRRRGLRARPAHHGAGYRSSRWRSGRTEGCARVRQPHH